VWKPVFHCSLRAWGEGIINTPRLLKNLILGSSFLFVFHWTLPELLMSSNMEGFDFDDSYFLHHPFQVVLLRTTKNENEEEEEEQKQLSPPPPPPPPPWTFKISKHRKILKDRRRPSAH
jgi:hypothetical protein